MENKVSIVIPVYNVEKYLYDTINCLIAQSFNDLEIILVDDGSNDKSGIICDEIAKKDSRFKVIHKKNGGVSSARNEGLKFVTGKYLYFMDADDWIEKDFIETMINKIEQYKADVCVCNFSMEYCGFSEVFSDNKKEIELSSIESINEMLRQNGNNLFLGHLWNKLFLTEKVKNIIFDESISVYEDLEYVYRGLKECNKVIYIPYIGYHYVQRSKSAMNSCFSNKTFSSINVAEELLNDILKMNNETLKNVGISFYVRTNLKQASMCSYFHGDIKFLKEIQKNIRNVKKSINNKQYYTVKDKVFIRLISVSVIFFNLFYNIFIRAKKRKMLAEEERRLFL